MSTVGSPVVPRMMSLDSSPALLCNALQTGRFLLTKSGTLPQPFHCPLPPPQSDQLAKGNIQSCPIRPCQAILLEFETGPMSDFVAMTVAPHGGPETCQEDAMVHTNALIMVHTNALIMVSALLCSDNFKRCQIVWLLTLS